MGGRAPRHEVRANDDSLCRVKFSIPPFDGKYDPDAYLTWELSVDQKFACYEFSDDKKVRAATSEFTDFASVWWHEYQTKNPTTIPQTWNALKRIMRNHFVPSYHARDLLHKLQQLRQGNKSVEEYYQELQIGMMRCGLVENEEAAMARFLGGLTREIQDILAYKEYTNVTRLFHLACKAEREVQGRRTRTNTPTDTSNRLSMTTSKSAPPHATDTVKGSTQAAPKTSSSLASTGRMKDIQCLQCKGFGHVRKDCPSKRVLIVRENGEYSSASDLDDETYAMLAAKDARKGNDDEEHIGAEHAEHYESLVVRRVLSTQMSQAEQNQQHNLFQTKCVVLERSCRIIIDGGSCNNLASTTMVEKLGMKTLPHPHPYYIQWFNDSEVCFTPYVSRCYFAG
ncbi:hypothetical protein PAHAL_8G161700 [Panicum hallii]|uniref:CCHC-type domain-containing protein n=1 Tax=Panicum hallii TaxID=206008 RepID=A0A2T8I902_9POAL|nr:hypothetical protein PAHAL_8G161700 [Panicum hallii]